MTKTDLKHDFQKGFTLIEVILVVTLITIASGLGILFFQGNRFNADLNAFTQKMVADFRLAQSDASAGNYGGEKAGIHLEEDKYITFRGETFDPNSVNNIEVGLPNGLILQEITLNGDGSDIIFDSDGKTDEYGEIKLFSLNTTEFKLILITPLGTIDYQ